MHGTAIAVSVLACFLLVSSADAKNPLAEDRYCGEPVRTASGDILRRRDVLDEFKRLHPCPSTGKLAGPCPGWAIDHVIPLKSCGCDSVDNLQWLPNELKSCAGKCKDRWERKVYQCKTR